MRRKYLVTVLALPLVNALSLANFQEITSVLIPEKCLETYNKQIDDCAVDDFNVECSRSCQRSLRRVGEDVTEDCSGVILNPNSLLGIVKAGNIITALCPQGRTTTTSQRQTSTAAPTQTIDPPPLNPPVTTTGSLETLTTSTTSSPPSTVASSTQTQPNQDTTSTRQSTFTQPSTTQSSSLPSSSSSSTVSNPPIQSTYSFGDITSVSTSTAAAAVTTSPPNQGKGSNGSGGGSPFDIVSGASNTGIGRELAALILSGWAFILFGR